MAGRSLSGAATLFSQTPDVCSPNTTPGDYDDTWSPCTLRKYALFDTTTAVSLHMDADEWPDSLIVTGPGVDIRFQIMLHEPYYSNQDVVNLPLGCGYQYYTGNGGVSPWTCDCIALNPSDAHGTVRLAWSFEQEMAEAFRVTLESDTL